MLGGREAGKEKETEPVIVYLVYFNKEGLSGLQRDIGEVERRLKALIKSLQNKHLNP